MKKKHEVMKYLSLITQIGFMMAIPIIGCILLGSFLDRLLNTRIVFLVIFTILGTLSAFRNLFVIGLKKVKKPDKKEGPK